jgi:hypothetical protein
VAVVVAVAAAGAVVMTVEKVAAAKAMMTCRLSQKTF